MSDVRAFAEAFFTHFGARTFPLDDNLVADLPPDLAAVFGKPRLYLVFAEDGVQRELSPVEDLVVYGSRTFDQMLTLLEGRGEVTIMRLPVGATGRSPLHSDAPLPLHNCRVIESQADARQARFYVVNYRAVYLSDEKQEEFMTVVLDAEGRSRPDRADELTHPSTGSGRGAIEHPEPVEGCDSNLEGCSLPVDKKTLRRMAGRAGKVARRQAEVRAAELEAAIRPRLQKGILRLTTFYRRLADEVDTGDPAQDETVRADLGRDLARKIADELESHRLRVSLSPLSCAVVLVPIAHYRLALATRHTQHHVEVDRDLHTGQIEGLICRHCREPIQRLALCDRGHTAHPQCVDACGRCGRDVCRACGIQPCAVCGNTVCIECIAVCTGCDRWLCAAHVETCPVCSEPVCPSCADRCATCGVSQCHPHMTPCLVCGGLTCAEHLWPCHICGRESCEAHADICAICGEPHCLDHSFRCPSCGQMVCARCELNGMCRTCRLALALDEAAIEPARVPAMRGVKPDRYRWRSAENREVVVYLGQSRLGQAAIVTDKAGRVVYRRVAGLLQHLAEALGIRP